MSGHWSEILGCYLWLHNLLDIALGKVGGDPNLVSQFIDESLYGRYSHSWDLYIP